MRCCAYLSLEALCKRARRAAAIATAMLVSGERGFDTQLRELRAGSDQVLCQLEKELQNGGIPVPERVCLIRLGTRIRLIIDSTMETAVLLRGKPVRVFALFDRVRMNAALTERLLSAVELLGETGKNQGFPILCEFRAQIARLSVLEERSFEKMHAEGQCEEAVLLSMALDLWRNALYEAASAVSELLLL